MMPLKIHMGTRYTFSEIYRQFGHTPSKRFASRGIEYPTISIRMTQTYSQQ